MWTTALCCLLVVVAATARNERILTVDERVELGEVDDAVRPGDKDVEATTPRALEVPRETAERLRITLKDRYLRSPLAVVVDTEPKSLDFTKQLWEATLRDMDEDGINLVLLPFNSSGMSNAYLTKGIPWFLQVLDAVAPVPVAPPGAGGVAFYSILKATEQIPFDSAILVFTGRPAVDEYLAQLTTATLIQKRCKLHVIWSGPSAAPLTGFTGGSESLLREVIDQTGGEFLTTGFVDKSLTPSAHQPNQATPQPGMEEPAKQEMVLAMRRQLVGTTAIPLSVDSTVHKIHVTIEGPVRAAVLRSPAGASIDLLSGEALRRLPPGGATVLAAREDRLEIEVDTSAAPPGVWTLTTTSDRRHDVSVAAVSGLGVSAALFEVVDNDRVDGDAPANASTLLRLTLVGVGSVDSVALVDSQGQELRRLSYQRRDDSMEASLDVDPNEQVTTDLDLPADLSVPQNAFVRVSGIDPTGAAFSRVSPVSERQVVSSSYPFVPGAGAGVGAVTVGVAANTSLYALPNTWHSLVFTVTNNRNFNTQYRFGARDDRGFIRYVRPERAYIGARLTYNVAVVMLAPPSTPYGTTDTVTLVVQGPSEVTNKSGTITIGDRVIDTERPHVSHSIKTNCRGYTEPYNCQTRIWNAEIEIIDRDAGILDIVSQPPGIRFMTDFVAGTKSTVVAYYSATCCENKVDVTVTDTNGNYVKYFINGDDSFVLSAGEIAAIVCGCLLLIILIVCIILAVCICKKNRSKSHDLPVHPRTRHN